MEHTVGKALLYAVFTKFLLPLPGRLQHLVSRSFGLPAQHTVSLVDIAPDLFDVALATRGIGPVDFDTGGTLEALNAIRAGVSQKEILAGVRSAVDAFVKEAPQFDDLTMLGLKYFGPKTSSESEMTL